MEPEWTEKDFLSCSGSTKLAREMAAAAPFADLDHAIQYARDIWFNKVDVKGWLEAFAAHPEIGATSKPISQWCKEEQSTAMATAAESTMQELFEWNALYKEKFGFLFLICASGRSSPEILAELKRRFVNRPIVELETAAEEEMKVIELRLRKLFDSKLRRTSSLTAQESSSKHEDFRPSQRLYASEELSTASKNRARLYSPMSETLMAPVKASLEPDSSSVISEDKIPGVSNTYMLGWLAIWRKADRGLTRRMANCHIE